MIHPKEEMIGVLEDIIAHATFITNELKKIRTDPELEHKNSVLYEETVRLKEENAILQEQLQEKQDEIDFLKDPNFDNPKLNIKKLNESSTRAEICCTLNDLIDKLGG